MPLLPREADILPENLFDLPSEEFPWVVAHVRSRQEKVLARHLAESGIGFYLPLTMTQRKRAGRTFTSHRPLFPGYVFVRSSVRTRDAIWRSNVVANLIEVQDQAQLGTELEQLRQLQLTGASLKAHHELQPGQPVRIESGAFSGYTGIVERGKGNDRLIVRISLIRQSVAVEFDREILRRVR
jgi:transcription antitermination factor NusG